MLTCALPLVAVPLLVLGGTLHTTDAQQYTHSSSTKDETMGASLVVNQLAILRMLEDSTNSCSAVPPNFLEKLQAQLEQDKQEFHSTITNFLTQMVELKNDTIADVQKMSEVIVGINSTKEEMAKVDEAVVDIQTLLLDTQTRLDITQTCLDDFQKRLEDIQTRINDTQTHLDNSQNRMNDTQTHLRDTQARVSIVESAAETTQADLSTSQTMLTRLAADLDDIKKPLNDQESNISNLTARLSNLEDMIQTNNQVVADIQREMVISVCMGNQVLHRLNGVLTVNLRGSYYDNMDCSWEVKLVPGFNIVLTWSYFQLETQDTCSYDYVQVEDLTRSNHLLYNGKLCGSSLPDRSMTNSHHLKITFHSDGSNVYEGFMLHYTTS